MFCSTIIPTIGRSTLASAVRSVLDQTFDREHIEVIVVNDSGKPLAQETWQGDRRVQIIDTQQRERSVARNTGAAAARGRYLHFLDDDDWLAPGALEHLWELSQRSRAVWLYGVSQLVDRQGRPLIQLQHGLTGSSFVQVMAGEWIPLQASLVEAAVFFQAGGFNPLLAGPEDIDLLRRVALLGELEETQQLVAYITRGEEGSTTDYTAHTQASRWAREIILDYRGAMNAMRISAYDSCWYGRILRIYLTSMLWNLKRKRFFNAMSRGFYAFLTIVSSGSGFFSPCYWQSVRNAYASETFRRGAEKAV